MLMIMAGFAITANGQPYKAQVKGVVSVIESRSFGENIPIFFIS